MKEFDESKQIGIELKRIDDEMDQYLPEMNTLPSIAAFAAKLTAVTLKYYFKYWKAMHWEKPLSAMIIGRWMAYRQISPDAYRRCVEETFGKIDPFDHLNL